MDSYNSVCFYREMSWVVDITMTKKEKEKEVSRHYRFVDFAAFGIEAKKLELFGIQAKFFGASWHQAKFLELFDIQNCFRLVHQILSLTGINFQTKSIIGYVDMKTLVLRNPGVSKQKLMMIFKKGMWSWRWSPLVTTFATSGSMPSSCAFIGCVFCVF